MASTISFAELTAGSLSAPRRIQASNLPLPASASQHANAEPGVEIRVDELQPEVLMEGKVIRTLVATSRFPASNDGHGEIEIESAPGAGIVLPGGINTYYLDFAPGMEFPLHRTTSLDLLIVVKGELTLVTPGDENYAVEDGKGTYKAKVYTTAKAGEVVSQRGIMHGLANRTDDWVRAYAIVMHSSANKVPVADREIRTLDDIFIA